MKFGSLFSGIGGIDLGLERAGMTCIWQSEIEPYACQVLAKHWPNIPNLGDIRDIDWTTVERADLVAGGYPCQPFSVAGHRAGGDDPRHLWPLFAECLRVLRPRYALLENVPGHLSLGFGQVLGDLAEIGYDAEWEVLSASGFGLLHQRERVFIVCYAQGIGWQHTINAKSSSVFKQEQGEKVFFKRGTVGDKRRLLEKIRATEFVRKSNGIPNRMDRVRGLGNAVVPQVAEYIGQCLMAHNRAHSA